MGKNSQIPFLFPRCAVTDAAICGRDAVDQDRSACGFGWTGAAGPWRPDFFLDLRDRSGTHPDHGAIPSSPATCAMKRVLQVDGNGLQLRPEGVAQRTAGTGAVGGDRPAQLNPFSLHQKTLPFAVLRPRRRQRARETAALRPSAISTCAAERQWPANLRLRAQHDSAGRPGPSWKAEGSSRWKTPILTPLHPEGRPRFNLVPKRVCGGECSACPSHPNLFKAGLLMVADWSATLPGGALLFATKTCRGRSPRPGVPPSSTIGG